MVYLHPRRPIVLAGDRGRPLDSRLLRTRVTNRPCLQALEKQGKFTSDASLRRLQRTNRSPDWELLPAFVSTSLSKRTAEFDQMFESYGESL